MRVFERCLDPNSEALMNGISVIIKEIGANVQGYFSKPPAKSVHFIVLKLKYSQSEL